MKVDVSTLRKIIRAPNSILFALMGFAALIWAFLELADEVQENETAKFDRNIMLSLRNPNDVNDPLGPVWVQELARDLTALGGVGVLTFFVLAASGYLWLSRNHRLTIFLLGSVATGILLSQGLKSFFDRARPDLVSQEAAVYTASFPSGHTLMSTIVYLTLAVLVARTLDRTITRVYVIFLATFLVISVGLSRVYLGVHWPTDVLAGWAVGAAWALLCGMSAKWLTRRGDIGDRKTPTGEI